MGHIGIEAHDVEEEVFQNPDFQSGNYLSF
jgi:hypothetical protein